MSLLTILASTAQRVLHSFEDTYPPARYDAVAWTFAHIEESVNGESDWTEVTRQAIPADATPATPDPIDLTVPSSLERGYFRFRFSDAAGNYSPYTDAVFSPRGDVPLAVRPSVNDVALLLRTRTVGGVATGLGGDTGPNDVTTFDATTRPTAQEVDRVIEAAYGAVVSQINESIDEVPVAKLEGVKHAIALYAAVLIEMSFFKETSDQVPAWREMVEATLAGINVTTEDVGRARFGSLTVGTIVSRPVPNHDPVVGIDA